MRRVGWKVLPEFLGFFDFALEIGDSAAVGTQEDGVFFLD
jgi:hypothetical protein